MQNDKVIAYESQKLKKHQHKYSTYDLKLIVVVHALKVWQYYLLGKRYFLKKNHVNLTNVFNEPTLNVCQAQWTTFLSEFDFEIKHLKGKENRAVDELSRKLHHVYEISFSQVELNFADQLKEAAQKDPEYSYLWQQVKSAQGSAKQREYSINSEN